MITYLTSLLHRLEDRFIGDVSSIMAPLTGIQSKLQSLVENATVAEAAARADAEALVARANSHADKVSEALKAADVMLKLLNPPIVVTPVSIAQTNLLNQLDLFAPVVK